MNLRQLRCAILENADGAVLMADVNKFCRGEAVAASGTFAAGFIQKQQLVSVQVDGDRVVIFYTE